MTNKRILVVDDEQKMRRILEIMLQKLGHEVVCAGNGLEALQALDSAGADLIITDLRMPRMDGIELLAQLHSRGIDIPVIVITAHSTVESAVDAMKLGAADYLQRPFDIDVLELAIKRIWAASDLTRENQYLREQINRGLEDFIGTSAAMQRVYEQIRQVAPTKTTVLLSGATGTGKELAARAIHRASTRPHKLFVTINCAAIPADILESELFGYDKGAFTGAVKERIGKFELADGGTIFLDEITEMPIALQAKLLRVLQENTLERLGSNRIIPLDLRVIAATNSDPRAAVRNGKLREDLYYRLNVFAIDLPALNARPEDIPALAAHFIVKHAMRSGAAPRITAAALALLQRYSWPGNVRELENMIERALIVGNGADLDKQHFPLETQTDASGRDSLPTEQWPAEPSDELPMAQPPLGSLDAAVARVEAAMIAAALTQTSSNKAKAAALLDISERALWYKVKKYRL